MKFKLTSSQMNFYNKNFTLDSQIWNQGVMQIFPEVYSYEQINTAYNKLVETHDSLRVKLVETENGVVADVREHEHFNYRFWQVETEEELMSKAQDFLNEPIDRYGLLVNCAIFQTPTTSGFMINAHHIVVDGFSVFVMAEHVNGFLKDENFAPSIQKYSDYVEAEEKFRQSRRYEKSKQYWLKQFSSAPSCNIFPTPENIIDFSSTELNHSIHCDLFNKIKELCNKNDITPASFFNTVIATYLQRKYDLESFTIGVPVFNRTTPDELNTIGLYMHIVPLVVSLENDTFIANAQRINDSQMNLFRHQSFTQYDIKQLLDEDDFSVDQLFDIVSDFQEFSESNDYKVKIPYANSLSIPIEMHLQTFDGSNYNLKIRYRTAYFEENDIQLMLKSIISLVENALENPNKNISELEIISSDEKQMLLCDFNSTEHSYNIPDKSTLYSLFDSVAEANKDKACIRFDRKETSFGEFRNKVEALDCRIREITEGKKSIVAVICERSLEMYTAIYGTIRGGNAYLPIDPDYPQDRIDYILENSNAAVVLAQDKFTHLAGNVPCINMTELVNNDAKSTDIPSCVAEEDDTAYVIYTSGSTGNPKGAKVSHKSAVNRILWMHDKYPLLSDDVILQKTPYTFDVSVWEHFWWGIIGGCLAPSKPGEHFLPAKILDEVFNNKVTHLHFVPSVFELFLNYLETHKNECIKFSSVKYVFLSGEALSANLIKRFYELFDYNKVTLHNLYGPTECAVDVTYYDCSPADVDPVPIGKPIYNTQMYVVDKYMNPVPVGVTGELCICGVNVGQGYLNNEKLTNEKFIDNPFGEGKLYKTGDLAYWREDGNIGFVGRNDFQVKIHGQRIELGEIENAITSVDGIVQSAVVVRKDNNNGQYICAFYTGEDKTAQEIKSIIGEKLPKYMLPHVFCHLDEMPMTVSGKTDRNALPEIDLDSINTDTVYVAPETEAEKALADVICSVLKVDNINMLDNFFNIGGDSIKAIYVVSELEEKGYEIHVADIMQNNTLSDVAKTMNATSDKVMYEQGEVTGFIPFTPIMRAYLNENNAISKDFIYTCVVSVDCDENTVKKALDILVSRHDILRGNFTDNGIEILSSGEREFYSFETVAINDTESAKEHLKNSRLDDKLIKVIYCKTENETFISISIHHFLIDLVSWETLLKDFETIVAQLKNNEEISLPPKTASFMMWSDELKKYSETIPEETKEYWKNVDNTLDNITTVCSEEENEEEYYTYTFDENTSNKLLNEANSAYGTKTNELLLTALGLAACNIADGSVGINVESHGRVELSQPVAIDHTVGWFTTCYPVVINNSGSIVDELINVKETLRMIPKNGIDYLLLSQVLHKNADIIFNFYHNTTTDDKLSEFYGYKSILPGKMNINTTDTNNLLTTDGLYKNTDLILNSHHNTTANNKFTEFYGYNAILPGKININATITNNLLTIEVFATNGKHKPGITEELGIEFINQIEKIVDLCTTTDTVIKTRSDFSDDKLTDSELDELKDLFDWTDDNE